MVFVNDESGRAFTHYEPNCSLNQHISQQSNSQNTHAFRSYLQQNANKIRQELADCSPDSSDLKKNCDLCPSCNQALKPFIGSSSGDTSIDTSKIVTNNNPYNLNPNL
jgi:hypothetical protein